MKYKTIKKIKDQKLAKEEKSIIKCLKSSIDRNSCWYYNIIRYQKTLLKKVFKSDL